MGRYVGVGQGCGGGAGMCGRGRGIGEERAMCTATHLKLFLCSSCTLFLDSFQQLFLVYC